MFRSYLDAINMVHHGPSMTNAMVDPINTPPGRSAAGIAPGTWPPQPFASSVVNGLDEGKIYRETEETRVFTIK